MKNLTLKLITAITAASLITCGLAACKNEGKDPKPAAKETTEESWVEEPPTSYEAFTAGGWEIPEDNKLNVDMENVFDEAVGQLDGYFYDPVMLLGTQMVSGTNYAFLCKSNIEANNGVGEYVITYIYEDLNGNVTYIGDEQIDLPGAAGANVTGGWSYSIDPTITPDIEKVMETATETLTGATYEPVAYIGSQVVAGYNHAILCKSSPSVDELDGETTYVLVYIYADLDGGCEITSTVDINLGI